MNRSEFTANLELQAQAQKVVPSWQKPSTSNRRPVQTVKPSLFQRILGR